MQIYIILSKLLENPHNFKLYKDLIKIYEERNDSNIVEALSYLIENKNVTSSNTTNQEQPRNN